MNSLKSGRLSTAADASVTAIYCQHPFPGMTCPSWQAALERCEQVVSDLAQKFKVVVLLEKGQPLNWIRPDDKQAYLAVKQFCAEHLLNLDEYLAGLLKWPVTFGKEGVWQGAYTAQRNWERDKFPTVQSILQASSVGSSEMQALAAMMQRLARLSGVEMKFEIPQFDASQLYLASAVASLVANGKLWQGDIETAIGLQQHQFRCKYESTAIRDRHFVGLMKPEIRRGKKVVTIRGLSHRLTLSAALKRAEISYSECEFPASDTTAEALLMAVVGESAENVDHLPTRPSVLRLLLGSVFCDYGQSPQTELLQSVPEAELRDACGVVFNGESWAPEQVQIRVQRALEKLRH